MARHGAEDASVTALLGPTNTGKTHLAVDRMLAHRTGMMGFPLRLLAREVYDRVVAEKGAESVALVTGEEKRVPAQPRYFVCTVESMPLERPVEFVAVDEIQLAGDAERGHVFTDRLLRARGTAETMLLGADTMRPLIRTLVPEAYFTGRPRLSTLAHAGHCKLARLAPRNAVVAFSTESVYALAERVRGLRGGCAVVLGALSPRTRNAQVALYQAGEVDSLVATDAIGMGLNLDLEHVAFSAWRKFDGRVSRMLGAAEIAQIAGRAGRHLRDGSFGTTGAAAPFEPDLIKAIEDHRFAPVERAWWRNADLAFDYAARSWGRERRVVARLEASTRGFDARYVVTSLEGDPRHLYEDIYCARGQAENLIKLHKGQLASDRTSCQSPLANQLRLVLHTAAYWLMLIAAVQHRVRHRLAPVERLAHAHPLAGLSGVGEGHLRGAAERGPVASFASTSARRPSRSDSGSRNTTPARWSKWLRPVPAVHAMSERSGSAAEASSPARSSSFSTVSQ